MKRTFLILALLATGCAYTNPNPTAPSPNFTTATTVGPNGGVVTTTPAQQPLGKLSATLSAFVLDSPRVDPASSCQIPTCFQVGVPVSMHLAVVDDRVGIITADTYHFDAGDGATLDTKQTTATHVYPAPGNYPLSATASMIDGRTATATFFLMVR